VSRCVINVSFGEWYPLGQQRLIRSLIANDFDGDIMAFGNEAEVDAPLHKDNRYAFKPYAFSEAKRQGQTKLLWLDAAIIVIKPLNWVFEQIEKDGCFFIDNGQKLGEWSSDDSLKAFGITREKALTMPEITACVLGLDLSSELGSKFLEDWQSAADAGLFHADWFNDQMQVSFDDRVKGHRHDQTLATLIADKLGMTKRHEGLFHYAKTKPSESIIFVSDGGGIV